MVNNMNNKRGANIGLSVYLSITMVFPSSYVVASSAPLPTDRWRNMSKQLVQSFAQNLSPVELQDALPKLAADGILSGTAKVRIDSNGKVLVIDQETDKGSCPLGFLRYWL